MPRMPRRRQKKQEQCKALRIDSRVPVLVQMHVECARCGYTGDETYEFDKPFTRAQPMESCESGECPECGAPVLMYLKRMQQRQQ